MELEERNSKLMGIIRNRKEAKMGQMSPKERIK